MIHLRKQNLVKAPRETVFDYMDDPEHQVEITPSMSEVRRIERIANGGIRAEYIYKMGGIPLKGSVEATEYQPKDRIAFKLTGAIRGEIFWLFEDENGETRFTYETKYEIPGKVVERLARPFVEAYNDREMDSVMANLKARLEKS
jgi:carbon monoxide dehydrogenase subunit G